MVVVKAACCLEEVKITIDVVVVQSSQAWPLRGSSQSPLPSSLFVLTVAVTVAVGVAVAVTITVAVAVLVTTLTDKMLDDLSKESRPCSTGDPCTYEKNGKQGVRSTFSN